MSRTSRTALLAALGLITATGATATVFGTATAGAATPGCKVDYQITNQWSTGFGTNVTVTNTGDPVASWTLEWSYAGNQQVTQGWNATITQSGAAVTAKNVSYNGTLATGGSTSFGFNGSYSGTNAVPATFKLNGVVCNGATEPTTPLGLKVAGTALVPLYEPLKPKEV
ncbi:cellulose-binding domain-containing protein, partial [Streptomyces venezuelae]|uniref:cellulose-binding domain-containing protein n=1 Tax=Streptomyces venezuelae TaxID=54571 RepID=UPI001F3C457A